MRRIFCCSFSFIALLSCSSPESQLNDSPTTQVKTRRDTFPGANLPSNYENIERNQGVLTYRGPINPDKGCISYGPYASQEGEHVSLAGSIHVEAKLTPNTYKECDARDIFNNCTRKVIKTEEPGLTIDLIAKDEKNNLVPNLPFLKLGGQNINGTYTLATVSTQGAIKNAEIRICQARGKEIDIKIHGVDLSWQWQDRCENPTLCKPLGQLLQYFDDLNAAIPPMFMSIIAHQANYVFAKSSEREARCFLSRLLGDPLLPHDKIAEVRKMFETTYHKSSDPFGDAENICFYDSSVIFHDIDKESCTLDDNSNICLTVLAYREVKKWYQSQIEQINVLKDSVVIKDNPGFSGNFTYFKTILEKQSNWSPNDAR